MSTKPGGDQQPIRRNFATAAAHVGTHLDDTGAVNRHVGDAASIAGAVDDQTVTNHKVMHGSSVW